MHKKCGIFRKRYRVEPMTFVSTLGCVDKSISNEDIALEIDLIR